MNKAASSPVVLSLGPNSVNAYRNELCKRALSDGGCTINTNAYNAAINHGFVVGGAGPVLTVRIDHNDTEKSLKEKKHEINAWLKDGLDHDGYPKYSYVGSWEFDGTFYFDWSDVIFDRDDAIALAHKRNELAIYDAANAESIDIPKG